MLDKIELKLSPLREQLKNHKLYSQIESIDDVKIFMENHVYAVWDFMSLLKSLQISLTNVTIPWTPSKNPTLTRFINEIVHGEESDLNELNEPKSHFEMYLEAMIELGANVEPIKHFITYIKDGKSIKEALNKTEVNTKISQFTLHTFDVISSNETHKIASAFTFGREDLIPDIFLKIINESNLSKSTKLKYYLERHIELDGDEHGPLSLEMISELCGNDQKKWNETLDIAIESLKFRLNLWDAISEVIVKNKLQLA